MFYRAKVCSAPDVLDVIWGSRYNLTPVDDSLDSHCPGRRVSNYTPSDANGRMSITFTRLPAHVPAGVSRTAAEMVVSAGWTAEAGNCMLPMGSRGARVFGCHHIFI